MAIFTPPDKSKPSESPSPDPTNDRYQREYKTAAASSKKQKLSTLLTNIEGYSWTVTYFQQVLGEDESPQPQSVTLDPTLQQYHRVDAFEIRVQSPLDYEYTKERQSHWLNGSGVIVPGTLVPNRGDMFIADVGDGRSAIFTILDVTPMSYMLEKAYEITYESVSSVTEKRTQDFERKVVKKSVYSKDFLLHGKNPVLSQGTVVHKEQLDHHGQRLLSMFTQEAVSTEHRHILIPSQEVPTYDPYLTTFLRKTLNTSQYPRLRLLNWPTHTDILELNVMTVWDLLMDPQAIDTQSLMDRVTKHMSPVATRAMQRSPFFNGLYYSSIKRILWPSDTADSGFEHKLADGTDRGSLPDTDDDSDSEDGEQPKLAVYPVLKDDYYVFSQAFYTGNRENMSELEHRVTMMLNQEQVPADSILELCRQAYSWPALERFYYVPVLLSLIQYAVHHLDI